MKGYFYGVYAKNLVGVYDNWHDVLIDKECYHGFKVKKFRSKEAAINFIEIGLVYDYHKISYYRLNEKLLIDNPLNTPISIPELTIQPAYLK